MKNQLSKKTTLFITGALILTVGVAFILHWWVFLQILFKGAIGLVLALAGLIMLYLAK